MKARNNAVSVVKEGPRKTGARSDHKFPLSFSFISLITFSIKYEE